MFESAVKESNKSRFDSYSVRNSISHVTFWDSRVHIFFGKPYSK